MTNNLRPGLPTIGCEDCLYHAKDSADQNWCDANGRIPQSDPDYAEIASWAAAYVENGDSSPCSRCEIKHEEMAK